MEYLEKGITAQPRRLIIKVMIGDTMNKTELALLGIIDSLIKSLNPSLNGWNKPKIPITFGPLRL